VAGHDGGGRVGRVGDEAVKSARRVDKVSFIQWEESRTGGSLRVQRVGHLDTNHVHLVDGQLESVGLDISVEILILVDV
jgi:hypothetical protein